MENEIAERINQWRLKVKTFEGLPALFWAGRLSEVLAQTLHGASTLARLSYNLELLNAIRQEYDAAVLDMSEVNEDLSKAFKDIAIWYNRHTNVTGSGPSAPPKLCQCPEPCKAKVAP